MLCEVCHCAVTHGPLSTEEPVTNSSRTWGMFEHRFLEAVWLLGRRFSRGVQGPKKHTLTRHGLSAHTPRLIQGQGPRRLEGQASDDIFAKTPNQACLSDYGRYL